MGPINDLQNIHHRKNRTHLTVFTRDIAVNVHWQLLELSGVCGSRATRGVAVVKPETRQITRAAVDARRDAVDVLDLVVASPPVKSAQAQQAQQSDGGRDGQQDDSERHGENDRQMMAGQCGHQRG